MLIIDGIIFSLQVNGGISVYTGELFNRAILAGINIELLLYDKCALLSQDNCSHATKLLQKRFAERYRDCKSPDKADLFHSSYYRLPESKKSIAVTTVHDFTYERFTCGPKRWLHSQQKFRAIRESAAIICVSENTRKDLLEFLPDISEERVKVVHNGVGDSYFPLPEHDSSNVQRQYVLFVGSRVGYKNFAVAVNALALLQDFELVCVGGRAFTESERAILERSIPGRYRHEGTVNNERLNYLYNHATCLLYPSSYEGFGIPVLEAMRAGCPVVALNLSSIPEVAGNAAVLLESAEPNLIAKSIEQLTGHDFRQGIRQKGFMQSSFFSWDNTYNHTVKVYEEVLGHALPRNACIGSQT